jgi:hypothetical protein
MPGLGSQLQNIATAMQGFSAGLQGQLPQFQQVQQQRLVQEEEQRRYNQEQQQKMVEQRQQTMFTDANAALQLVKMGNLDGAVQLGLNRLKGLEQLSQQFPDIDPSDTQRVTQLAIAARNGDEEALEHLTAELESTVQVGKALGILATEKPEIIPQSAVSPTGQVAMRNADGTLKTETLPGFTAAAEERKTAQDQNGILRFVDDGEPVFPEVEKLEADLTDKDRFDRAKSIRGEIDTANKDFTVIANSWDRIASSADAPSAAGDLALLFNFMKMLDPGSTVRESEFANAQSAGSIPERMRGAWQRVISGQRLTPDQRIDFYNQAQNIFDAAGSRANAIRDEYVRLAERSGLTRDDVVVERGAAPVIDHGKIGRFTVTEVPEGH